MNITKKDLTKSQIELTVEMPVEEFGPYIKRGTEKVSHEVKIEGFRPGHVPYEILKSKIGEMTILEEAAKIAIDRTIDKVIKENVSAQIVGQPQISITKLAPVNPLEYKVILTLLPEVKLTDYKNVKIKCKVVSVKDEEVDKLVDELREMRAKEVISEEPVKLGDRVIIDIAMFLDQVPLESGQNKGIGIIIGKNYIIPGFDKKLIGACKGDSREFSLTYPEDFHQSNLAGKLVDFKVTIKEIYKRELPVLDHELAKGFGLNSVDDLKENVKKSLLAEKERAEAQKDELAMLDSLVEKSKFGDVPEILIKHEAEVMMSELEYNLKIQGGKFEDYLLHLKKSRDQLILDLLPEAIKRVKVSLVVRQIANLEKIEVSEEEVNQAIADLLKQYKDDKNIKDRIEGAYYRQYLANNLVSRKTIEKLKEWNFESH